MDPTRNDEPARTQADASFPAAIEVIANYDQASASLLQRRLGIGPTEADRLIEQLRATGYLDGAQAGSWNVRHDRLGHLSQQQTADANASLGGRRGISYLIGQLIVVAVVVGVVAVGGNWLLTVGLRQPDGPVVQQATEGDSACVSAFEDAADGSVLGDVEYDLDPAMSACASVHDWSVAFGMFPLIRAGDDPRFVAENRCMTGKFSDTPICRELGITP